jgi:pimeloyl-ACP methyl ester carboxylesterase
MIFQIIIIIILLFIMITILSYIFLTDGCLKSVSERIAFPTTIANSQHVPVSLKRFENIDYYEYTPRQLKNNKILVFCHGNAMTVDKNSIILGQQLADATGSIIYMPEYQGYGESRDIGSPSAESCVTVLEQLMQLISQSGHRTENIYLMGHSMGTGVIARYAERYRYYIYGGIILLAPYKSITQVITNNFLIEVLLSAFNFYNTYDIINKITWPILIVHGTRDHIIPISHSIALSRKNPAIIFHQTNNDHNNIVSDTAVHNLINTFIHTNKSNTLI